MLQVVSQVVSVYEFVKHVVSLVVVEYVELYVELSVVDSQMVVQYVDDMMVLKVLVVRIIEVVFSPMLSYVTVSIPNVMDVVPVKVCDAVEYPINDKNSHDCEAVYVVTLGIDCVHVAHVNVFVHRGTASCVLVVGSVYT